MPKFQGDIVGVFVSQTSAKISLRNVIDPADGEPVEELPIFAFWLGADESNSLSPMELLNRSLWISMAERALTHGLKVVVETSDDADERVISFQIKSPAT